MGLTRPSPRPTGSWNRATLFPGIRRAPENRTPVVDLLPRVGRVVADPRLVRVLAPLEEIPRRELRRVDDSLRFLHRCADDREPAVGQDRVAAEDRPEVDDEDRGAAPGRLEGGGESGDSRPYDDDVRLAGLTRVYGITHEDCAENEKTLQPHGSLISH
jgi:hypothetical protein